MNLSQTRKGELAIIANELLWGLFPIITILSYSTVSAVYSLAFSAMFSCVFFAALMLIRGKFFELRKEGIYKHILIISFLIGWLYYGLYYAGLKFTSAGNASILALMELFFSYLFFNVWKKQPFSKEHTTGAVLILIGAVIILWPKEGLDFSGGDWFILIACACATLGNYYQQSLRKIISSETILFLRNLFSFPFFFLLAYLLQATAPFHEVKGVLWLLILNGFVVLGFTKFLWVEGIHRISVTKATSFSVVAVSIKLKFAYIFLHQSLTLWQWVSLIPVSAGLILLTYEKKPAK